MASVLLRLKSRYSRPDRSIFPDRIFSTGGRLWCKLKGDGCAGQVIFMYHDNLVFFRERTFSVLFNIHRGVQ